MTTVIEGRQSLPLRPIPHSKIDVAVQNERVSHRHHDDLPVDCDLQN